ncbi:MAG: hypothetical protein ACOYCD_09350 [Kiritimatiellia bacterium]|jgi:hypothetical protein
MKVCCFIILAGALDLDGRRRLDYFMRRSDMGAYEHMPVGSIISIH